MGRSGCWSSVELNQLGQLLTAKLVQPHSKRVLMKATSTAHHNALDDVPLISIPPSRTQMSIRQVHNY